MAIRETHTLANGYSRFDASSAEETLRELEEQYAAGELSRYAYFEKKRSLVRLFVKSTTSPKRRRRDTDYDAEQAAK
ncbi:hypothetical protein [Leucobacter sp. USHLN153]|uniref:hypothetical protein n=1 Tax=Leucobacter sp. USHLN153 TaxID=3081268 RepID=UPI00301A4481